MFAFLFLTASLSASGPTLAFHEEVHLGVPQEELAQNVRLAKPRFHELSHEKYSRLINSVPNDEWLKALVHKRPCESEALTNYPW